MSDYLNKSTATKAIEALRDAVGDIQSSADTITRQRDLIRELVEALDEAMDWNWLEEDMPGDIVSNVESLLTRARKELNDG